MENIPINLTQSRIRTLLSYLETPVEDRNMSEEDIRYIMEDSVKCVKKPLFRRYAYLFYDRFRAYATPEQHKVFERR